MKRRIYWYIFRIDVAPSLWELTLIVDLMDLSRRQTSSVCMVVFLERFNWGDDPQWLNVGGTIARAGVLSASAPWSLCPGLPRVRGVVCVPLLPGSLPHPSFFPCIALCEAVCHIRGEVMNTASYMCLKFSGCDKHTIVNYLYVFLYFISLQIPFGPQSLI